MEGLVVDVVGYNENRHYGFDQAHKRKPEQPKIAFSQLVITPDRQLARGSLVITPRSFTHWDEIVFSHPSDYQARVKVAAKRTVETQLRLSIDNGVLDNTTSLEEAVNDLESYYMGFNTFELLRCRSDQLVREAKKTCRLSLRRG